LQKLAYQNEAALNDADTIPSLTQTLPEWEAVFQRQIYLKAVRDGTIVDAVRGYEQNGTSSLPANAALATCTYIRSWAIISIVRNA
jgi:hypothetical protein